MRQEKEMKEIQIEMEDVTLSLFSYNMILYLENPKKYIKVLLKLINTLGKVVRYKISIKKLIVCPYTNNEFAEEENCKIIPFTRTSRKHLGII